MQITFHILYMVYDIVLLFMSINDNAKETVFVTWNGTRLWEIGCKC